MRGEGGNGATLRVWGCRGSLPVPGSATARYGGDTSCYEILAEGAHVVVDCGSGLRALGQRMMREGPPERLDILLSHVHFDHLIGLGFFAPLIKRRTALTIWTANDPGETAEALHRLYSPPLWPARIPGDYDLAIRQVGPEGVMLGSARIGTFALNHPGGCTGFRVWAGGRVICFVADHEHGDAAVDAGILRAVAGADLMIYDAAYPEAEYERHRGWGHSTPEAAARLAGEAGVARTLLVHHGIGAEDDALDAAGARLPALAPRIEMARDGMEFRI